MGNNISNAFTDSINNEIENTLAKSQNEQFSIGKAIANQFQTPTINIIYDDSKAGISRVASDIETTGKNIGNYVNDTTRGIGDIIGLGGTMIFIVFGGTILLYPEIWDSAVSLSRRISQHGVRASIEI